MAQTVLFYDTFDGEAGTPLPSRAPDVGLWGQYDGSMAPQDITLSGGGSIAPTGWVELTTQPLTKPSGVAFEAIRKIAGPGRASLVLAINSDFGTYAIADLYSDGLCMLSTETGSVTAYPQGVIPGITLALKVEASGTSMSVNGTPVLSKSTSAALLSSTTALLKVSVEDGAELEYVVLLSDPDGAWDEGGGGSDIDVAVQGTINTQYGAPNAGSAFYVSGDCGTEYGALASSTNYGPDGVLAIRYGAHLAYYDAVVLVQGTCQFNSAEPGARLGVNVASPELARYGQVAASFDVRVSLHSDEPSSRSGVPLAWHIESQVVTTVHDAYGSCSTVYGTPSAEHPQLGDVTGASLTAYGSLTSAVIAQPAAVSATAFGLPSAAAIASVPGVRGTKFGVPSNIVAHIVTGISRTKYGKVKAAFPDAHMVYGLNNGRRAGVPRAVEIA